MGSVLHIAAHPDDENTQFITYLRGRHCRAAYLSLTRGDGGQNVIGPEFFEELGVIRTQEFLAARRLDGGRQFFTRAIDFGFSKNPRETLSIWDRQQVLADIVQIIRTFRPDVVITRFSPQGGGHGHHTSSAILAVEAFKLASDPQAFPEQLKALTALAAEANPPERRRTSAAAGVGGRVRRRYGWRSAATTRSRRGARRDRRAEPGDAQIPGLWQLRRRRWRAADRVVPAPRRRACGQGHLRWSRYHLGTRARWRRGRAAGRCDHRAGVARTPPPRDRRAHRVPQARCAASSSTTS